MLMVHCVYSLSAPLIAHKKEYDQKLHGFFRKKRRILTIARIKSITRPILAQWSPLQSLPLAVEMLASREFASSIETYIF